jgi:2-octaprenyl-6-methoxyphenol hydroxylase
MVAAATDGLTRLYGVPGRTASAVRRFGMGLVGGSDRSRTG